MTAFDPREAASEWVGRLIERGNAAYQAFEVLADFDHAAPEALAIRRALCAIIDILVVEELQEAEAVRATANTLADRPLDCAASLFEAWAACLAAVQPHRKRMADVCSSFFEWVESMPSEFRVESMGMMPFLLGAHGGDALAWLPSLVALAVSQTDAERCAQIMELPRTYLTAVATENGKRTLETCAALIRVLPLDDWDDFCRGCPAETICQDSEASDFFEQFISSVPLINESIQPHFVRLMIALVEHSFSSAGYLAGRLPGKLAAMPEDLWSLYLEMFCKLVNAAGIAANRFAFNELPRRLNDGKADEVSRMVAVAESIGANYGHTAAIRYLKSL